MRTQEILQRVGEQTKSSVHQGWTSGSLQVSFWHSTCLPAMARGDSGNTISSMVYI